MVAFLGLFNEAASHVIEYEGQPLYSVYRVDLAPSAEMRVVFKSYEAEPVQGLIFKSKSGRLAVGDEVLPSFVLWTDTASEVVPVKNSSRKAVTVSIYNCWRDASGGPMSHLGSAAMRVDRDTNVITLRASDWTSPPCFEDLVAEIIVDG